jgi:uncharacterized protein
MIILCWDASALVKRYAPEVGSDTVDALFDAMPTANQVSSAVGYAEIVSILLRKFHRSEITRQAFATAKDSLRADLITDPDFVLLPIDDAAFYDGIPLMETHHLNSTDAALLVLFQAYRDAMPPDEDIVFVVVAADARLVRTAQAEGFQAVSPELLSASDVATFLAGL